MPLYQSSLHSSASGPTTATRGDASGSVLCAYGLSRSGSLGHRWILMPLLAAMLGMLTGAVKGRPTRPSPRRGPTGPAVALTGATVPVVDRLPTPRLLPPRVRPPPVSPAARVRASAGA
ncbi:hypothetical protein GCM10023237_03900 [Streptomyces coeruleoprunus]